MIDDKQLTEEYLDGKVVFPGKIIRVEHWHVRLPNGETALREVACHPGAAGIVARHGDGAGVNVGGEEVIVAGIFAAAGKSPLRLPYAARQAAPHFGGKLAVQPRRAVQRDHRRLDADGPRAAERHARLSAASAASMAIVPLPQKGSQKSPRPR